MISKKILDNGTTSVIYINDTYGVIEKKYNNTTISNSETYVTMSSGNKVKLKVKVSPLEKFNRLASVKLSVLLGVERYNIPLQLTFNQSSADTVVRDFVLDSETLRYEADITDLVIDKADETVSFELKTEGNYRLFTSGNDTPYMIVNYNEPAFIAKIQSHVSGMVGANVKYNADIRNGILNVGQSLYQFEGLLSPMNLGLTYCSYNGLAEIEEGLPVGWKFNYFQKLIISDTKISYLDCAGLVHDFTNVAENKYIDSTGSGLILNKHYDGSYSIFDGYNTRLYFNALGYLTSISEKLCVAFNSTGFKYDTSNRLIEIKDPMGNVVSISYTNNYIEITKDGYPTIKLIKSSNMLTSVDYSSGNLISFEYETGTTNYQRLLKIQNKTGETTTFEYDSESRVVNIRDTILKDNVESVLEQMTIDYLPNETKVTNYHNVVSDYTFSEDGNVVSYIEDVSGQSFYDLSCVGMQKNYTTVQNEKILELIGDSVTILNGELDSSGNQVLNKIGENMTPHISNLTFKKEHEYLVSFRYQITGANSSYAPNRGSYVLVYQSVKNDEGVYTDKQIASIKLDLNAKTDKFIQTIIKTDDSTSIPRFKVAHLNNVGTVSIYTVRVQEIKKNIRKVCFNFGETGVESINCEGIMYYPRTSPFKQVMYTNSSGQTVTKSVKVYEEDMQENFKNYVLANGGKFDFWYNKKKGLIPNISAVQIYIDSSRKFLLSSMKMCIVHETDDKTVFKYNDYSNSASVTNIFRVEYEKTLFQDIFYTNSVTMSRDFIPTAETKYNGLTKKYVYDNYSHPIKETLSSTANDLLIEKTYSYQNGKYLVSESTLSANLSTVTTKYNYNTLGLLSTIEMANGLIYTYTYDPNTLELTKVSCSNGAVLTENNIQYLNSMITNLSHKNNIGYDFIYDKYNMVSEVKSNYNGVKNSFITTSSMISSTQDEYIKTWPNGYKEKLIVDKYGNVVKKLDTYNSTFSTVKDYYYSNLDANEIASATNPLNISGKASESYLRRTVDKVLSNNQLFYYNDEGLLSNVVNTNSCVVDIDYDYDEFKRVVGTCEYVGDDEVVTTYTYRNQGLEPTNEIEKLNIEFEKTGSNAEKIVYTHENVLDSLKRISTLKNGLKNFNIYSMYTYPVNGKYTTELPSSLTHQRFSYGGTGQDVYSSHNYTYDKMNNIKTVKDSIMLVAGTADYNSSYEYDLFGRLVRENNQRLGKSVKYTYDDKGNITKKEEGKYSTAASYTINTTTSCSYSTTHPDRLVSYGGKSISYDLNGNVTAIGSNTFTWSKGKQLTRANVNGKIYEYTYNGDGVRTKKVSYDGFTHTYVLQGNKIMAETIQAPTTSLSHSLKYVYAGNEIIGFICDGNEYLFIKNTQHDIIGIVDNTGKQVATYAYDAWGNHKVYDANLTQNTSTTFIGNINPFRYRGYYYDVETGLFWCNSRYYNPEWGRWISPDSIEYLDPSSINGLNLYAYCGNDPVNRIDPDGHAWYHWALAAVAAVAVVGLAVCTAGAIIAAAPAVAGYATTLAVAYTGSAALGTVAATAVSIGAATLAVGTVAIGVNEGISLVSGRNFGSELLGEDLYNGVATVVGMGGYAYMMGGSILPYPSTGNTGSNLNEQLAIGEASSNPSSGKVLTNIKMSDPRMPSWLGWQKYSYSVNGMQVHYVGNRYFPNWYPYSPWFDFKIK